MNKDNLANQKLNIKVETQTNKMSQKKTIMKKKFNKLENNQI